MAVSKKKIHYRTRLLNLVKTINYIIACLVILKFKLILTELLTNLTVDVLTNQLVSPNVTASARFNHLISRPNMK